MLLVVRAVLGFSLFLLPGFASARDIYLLVVGDQSAANCQEHKYGPTEGVYQLALDGRQRPAMDPLDWADCNGGSIWMPLAKRLKQEPGVDKVVLLSVGVMNAKAQDFSQGAAATRLNKALRTAKGLGIKFDYALWQQGRADLATKRNAYLNSVRKVIKAASIKITIRKWLIGSEACGPTQLLNVAEAQAVLSKQVLLNRFPGPSQLPLDSQAQLTDCRLTEAGQEVMAQYWSDAIHRADRLGERYQREALISLFK